VKFLSHPTVQWLGGDNGTRLETYLVNFKERHGVDVGAPFLDLPFPRTNAQQSGLVRLHLRLIRFLRINRQLAIAVGHAACKEVLPSDEAFSIPSEFEIPTHDWNSDNNLRNQFSSRGKRTPKSVGGSTQPLNLLLELSCTL